MQMHTPPVSPREPRVFNYSLDWRFLLPASEPGNIFVAFDEDGDFSQTLQHVGIPASNQLSLADMQAGQRQRFQSLALPFGLPTRWVGGRAEEHTELFRSLHHRIEPGGHFLLGFANARYGQRTGSRYRAATPQRIASQLRQAGYRSIEVLGVMPNLRIPEYILQLQPSSILFALQHRFRRKPVFSKALRILSYAPGWTHISSLLPCYFAIAVA